MKPASQPATLWDSVNDHFGCCDGGDDDDCEVEEGWSHDVQL